MFSEAPPPLPGLRFTPRTAEKSGGQYHGGADAPRQASDMTGASAAAPRPCPSLCAVCPLPAWQLQLRGGRQRSSYQNGLCGAPMPRRRQEGARRLLRGRTMEPRVLSAHVARDSWAGGTCSHLHRLCEARPNDWRARSCALSRPLAAGKH